MNTERLQHLVDLEPDDVEAQRALLRREFRHQKAQREYRIARVDYLAELDADEEAQAFAIERGRRDPVWWANYFLWSYTPRSIVKATPFVLFDFQRELFLAVLGRKSWALDPSGAQRKLVVDKSRDMGVTYTCLAAMLWTWLYEADTKQGLVSKTGSDVAGKTEGSLFGKVLYMIESLPSWMLALPDWEYTSTPKPTLVNLRNGSSIAGTKTTIDTFRGDRLERCLVDEAASIPRLADVARSVDETGPVTYVSTPKGMANHFARMVHRRTGETILKPGECEGRYGGVHMRYHWQLDPRKGEEWEKKKRAETSDVAWASEYGIDYTASSPGRIWRHFNEACHVYTEEGWSELEGGGFLDGGRLIEGWDFGSGLSLTARASALYMPSTDTLYLIAYRQWAETHADDVCDDTAADGWHVPECRHGKHSHHANPDGTRCSGSNVNGRRPSKRVGDIAGKARDSTQQSWLSNLRRRGVEVRGQSMQYGRIEWSISQIDRAIRDGRLFCAPAFGYQVTPGLPTGVEVLQQYRRDLRSGRDTADRFVGLDAKPRKDQYSHLADAIQHLALAVWPMNATRMEASK